MGQVAVGGHQNVELLLSFGEQLPIAERRPAELESSPDFVITQVLAQRRWYALIEKDAH